MVFCFSVIAVYELPKLSFNFISIKYFTMSSSQIYFNQNFDSLRSFASPENDLISVVVEM